MGPPPMGPPPGGMLPPGGAGAGMDPMMQRMLMGADSSPEDQRMLLARAMALKQGGGAPTPGAPTLPPGGGMV